MFLDVHTHNPSTDPAVVAIENRYEGFRNPAHGRYVSAGLHPWYLNAATLESDLAALAEYALSAEVVALGECGLDKLTKTDWVLQCKAFEQQIGLAESLQKPLIVHCVKAFQECVALLNNVRIPVVFHGVNNRLSLVSPLIDAGYFLSFGKALLHPNPAIVESLNAVPLTQLFLETDDTGADIREMYKSASRLRNISQKEIALQLELNFSKVFKQ